MPDMVHFRRWEDPVLAAVGHPVHSTYVERFWLPIIGPTSLLTLRWADAMLMAATGDQISVELEQLGAMMGVRGTGINATIRRTLNRLVAFHCIQHTGALYLVRSHLAPLRPRQIEKLPPILQALHNRPAIQAVAS